MKCEAYIRLYGCVMQLPLTLAERVVLAYVADICNRNGGRCRRSLLQFCEDLNLLRNTIKAALRTLEQDGYIFADADTIGAGRGNVTTYTIKGSKFDPFMTIEKGSKSDPFNEEKGSKSDPFNEREEKGSKFDPFNEEKGSKSDPFNEEKGSKSDPFNEEKRSEVDDKRVKNKPFSKEKEKEQEKEKRTKKEKEIDKEKERTLSDESAREKRARAQEEVMNEAEAMEVVRRYEARMKDPNGVEFNPTEEEKGYYNDAVEVIRRYKATQADEEFHAVFERYPDLLQWTQKPTSEHYARLVAEYGREVVEEAMAYAANRIDLKYSYINPLGYVERNIKGRIAGKAGSKPDVRQP